MRLKLFGIFLLMASPAFGQVSGGMSVEYGGTGLISIPANRILLGGSPIVILPSGSSGQILTSGGTLVPSWITTVPVANGGTGSTSFTNDGVVYVNGSGNIVSTAAATDGQILIGSSTGIPALASITAGSGITITPGHNTITIASTGGMTNPMTTLGDLISGGTAGAATRLAGNTSNYFEVLTSTAAAGVAAAPVWNNVLTNYGVGTSIYVLGGVSTATGIRNVAMGYQAGNALTSGFGDVAIGYTAFAAGTSGFYNVAIGAQALAANTMTGNYNAAIGYGALNAGSSSLNSTAVGAYALFSNTTGSDNTAIGYSAGYAGTALTNGSDNTFIGDNSQTTSASASNQTALGYNATVLADNTVELGSSLVTAVSTYGHIVTQRTVGAATDDATGVTLASVVGSDVAGTVTLTTAVNATGGWAQIAFGTTYGTAPTVVIWPANAIGASLNLAEGAYVTETATYFRINFAVTNASAGATFNYIIIH